MEGEQLILPGFPPPVGFIFERQLNTVDYQSSNRSDGQVWWWREEFSRELPLPSKTIRNLKPVFDRTI